MELCQEGDLFKYLENKNFKLTEKDVLKIVKQLLSGIFYLHQYGINHRDLKPENILVKYENDEHVFKIADFGLSKIIGSEEMCEEPYGTLVSYFYF
jgi:serine/threonine protein kinase